MVSALFSMACLKRGLKYGCAVPGVKHGRGLLLRAGRSPVLVGHRTAAGGMKTFRTIRGLSALAIAASLFGCASVRDISDDPQYPTDYLVGAVYRTQQACVLRSGALWPTDRNIASVPRDFDEYVRGGGQDRWPDVAGFIEAGSTVVVEKILLRNSFELGKWMTITGRIQDGTFAGWTVELGLISRESPFPGKATALLVDTNYLEKVSSP